MPGRSVPLVINEIYHVFNRGIDHRPTFTDMREYNRALEVLSYYRFASPSKKLSYFLLLASDERMKIIDNMKNKSQRLIEIVAFCLMPNHFHFLLKQLSHNGISEFMSNFQNSYTRYFNTKNERTGPLFLDQFKAVRIETDEQFIHVSRYIHLNPLTSYVIKDFDSLKRYPWSSFKDYVVENPDSVCSTKTVLDYFKNKTLYELFVKDQIDYQRKLHMIKHLVLE